MKKTNILGLAFLAMTALTTSCSNDGGGNSPLPPNVPGNGPVVPNSGGDGKTVLAPAQQKAFVKETAQAFESLFSANEFRTFTSTAKELEGMNASALDNILSDIMQETFTGSRATPGTITCYDQYIMLSNLKGSYEAKAGGRWTQTKKDGPLTLTFTSKSDAVWKFTCAASGKLAEKVHIDTHDNSYSWLYPIYNEKTWDIIDFYIEKGGDIYEIYADIPKSLTAALTCNGVSKMATSINITSFNADAKNGVASLLTSCSGTANVSLTPAAAPYVITTNFAYVPNKQSSVNTVMTKGGVMILSASGAATGVTSSDEVNNVSDMTAKVDILGRLQVVATAPNGKIIADAYNSVRYGSEDEKAVKNAVSTINSGMTAYMTNNGGTAKQGAVKMTTTSFDDIRWIPKFDSDGWYIGYDTQNVTMFQITPVLSFSDGTSYAFGEYFTESYFKDILDFIGDFASSIERQMK